MYLLGYSLNNLSLMALTISTGFVVDDAIVMVENIARYIEEGEQAVRGRAQGREADRLHDRLAHGLAGRGADPAAVHGRAHRPAVPRVRGHARDRDRDLGGAVADADRDDVRAHPAAARRASSAGAVCRVLRARLRRRDRGSTSARSTWVLRHQRTTLLVTLATVAAHRRASRSRCPKGFFPQRGHRPDRRRHRGGARRLVRAMMELQQRARRRRARAIPTSRRVASFIGADGTNPTPNVGRLSIALKPRERARAPTPTRSSRACSDALATVAGVAVYLQPVQDLQIDARAQPHAVPVHARGRRPGRARDVGAADARRAARAARAARRRERSADRRARSSTSRSIATPRRGSASRRRRSTTRSTTRSASASSRRSSRSSTSTASSSRSSPRIAESDATRSTSSTCARRTAAPVPLSRVRAASSSGRRRSRSRTRASSRR